MRKKLLFGYTVWNILIFLIPFIFSFFIKAPVPVLEVFNLSGDEQSEKTSVMISVMDTKTSKVTKYNLEEYLIGVVSAEMPASYEIEALKAQAVAARSYILSKQEVKNSDHPNAVVCNSSSHCKGYLSLSEATEKWGKEWGDNFYPKIKEAVKSTKGECIYYNNEVIEAFFFALSNGKTESSKDVWASDLPYLKSTESKEDLSAPDFNSTIEVSLADFNQRLKNFNSSYKASDVINVDNIVYTEGGRIKNIDINSISFKGVDIRSVFGLNSSDFNIVQNEKKIIFNVKGKGHGVGMSQYGANVLAKKGYTYEEILKHYFSGVEIIYKE